MRRFLFIAFVFSIFFSISTSNSLASSEVKFPKVTGGQIDDSLMNIVPIRFLPSSPFYFLIWAKEEVAKFFQPSAARKAGFSSTLATKRVKEAYLLAKNGDIKNASSSLFRYVGEDRYIKNEFERARSQNQDIQNQINKAVEDLGREEILFSAINQKTNILDKNYNFSQNFNSAVNEFASLVDYLDTLKPGIRNRFTSLSIKKKEPEKPAATPYRFPSSTGSAQPYKIIY